MERFKEFLDNCEDEFEQLFESDDTLFPFIRQTVNWLLEYKFKPETANNKDHIIKLIVKYFESVNTIDYAFEQYEIGCDAWEGDYILAEKDYYPVFIEAYNQGKTKI